MATRARSIARATLILSLGVGVSLGGVASAETPQIELQIKNRAFVPAQLEVPADTKVKLVIHNTDSFPAEFESNDLSREVIIPGGATSDIYVGPLKAGVYGFFNDFHQASKGVLTAR